MTDRLIVLSYLSYELTENPDLTFKEAVKEDDRFPEILKNCELFFAENGMFCIIDDILHHLYFIFKGISNYNFKIGGGGL